MTVSPVRTSPVRTRSRARRPGALAAALLLALALGAASAFGPEDAYRAALDREDLDSVIRLERAQEDFARTRRGLSASLAVDPAVGYGGDIDEDPSLLTDLELSARVGYRYDAVDILEERIDLLEAQIDADDDLRARVQNFLEIHGDTLRLQLLVEARRETLEERRADLEERSAEEEPGSTALRVAQNRADEAEADLRIAEDALANIRARAATAGLEGEAAWERLAFELPEVAAEETPAYRRLELRLAYAEAKLREDGIFRLIERVSVTGLYESETDNYQLSAGADLDEGRPGAFVAAEYDGQGSDAWRIVLSADLRFDDASTAIAARAERDVERARDDLRDFLEFYPIRLAEARVALDIDATALEFETRTFELTRDLVDALASDAVETRSAIVALETERSEVLAALADAEDDEAVRALRERALRLDEEAEDARADLVSLERRLGNARSDLRDDLDDIYDTWLDYLLEVEDYLDVVQRPWVIVDTP